MANAVHNALLRINISTLLLIATAFPHRLEAFDAVCVGVTDGDTITMLDSNKTQHKIRLAQIDAPEKNQPFGGKSKESLSQLAFNKNCSVDVADVDKYKREVATVVCDKVNVNEEQIRRGLAWVYRKYLNDQSLLEIESQAREMKIGIWSESDPIPPWDWRRRNNNNN